MSDDDTFTCDVCDQPIDEGQEFVCGSFPLYGESHAIHACWHTPECPEP